MAEDPDQALNDRLGAALGELTDTLTTAQQVSLDAERGITQAQIDTLGSETAPSVRPATEPQGSP
jgi:hypothetical protein